MSLIDFSLDNYNKCTENIGVENEISFIKTNFCIRNCYIYSELGNDNCHCNHPKAVHAIKDAVKGKWSYKSNTRIDECYYHGVIEFSGCDDLCQDHRFIRFNVIEDSSSKTSSLEKIVKSTYTLMCDYWKIPKPELIISVIGGFKGMNISNHQKKNFKQGLIDVMKKDRTLIIGGGFNVGIHKLVSETVREFRIYHESDDNKAHLVGISTWGVVWNNEDLYPYAEKKKDKNGRGVFKYPSGNSQKKGKVALDPNYDCFLFCDDGTSNKYDKELDFRSEYEKYVASEAVAFAVQILFEGGSRAIKMALKTLENNISIVVLKGSGRAADVICDVIELQKTNLEKNIISILDEKKEDLRISDEQMPEYRDNLKEMYEKFKDKIIIYDMLDSTMKFGEKIVEAIVSGRSKRNIEDTLKLTIRFNCGKIAQKEVFSRQEYSKMNPKYISKRFIKVLKKNKFEFVNLFLENDIEIDKVVDDEALNVLYTESLNSKTSPYAELLNDLISNKSESKRQIYKMGKIISILSGNILQSFYETNESTGETTREDKLPFGTQDLFLWSLLSGRIELAEIFWRFGKCHISSALIGSTILKNMAFYILKRGDSELQIKLDDAAQKFEDLAFDVLTKAYSENKTKTYTILIRELKEWNKTTCFRIALSGNLLKFLSHSACRSYTTQIWMGGLSPFLSPWKVLLTIPLSPCFMHSLIMPSFHQIRSKRKNQSTPNRNIEEVSFSKEKSSTDNQSVTFSRAMKIFYCAPVVKFYINFASYLGFLLVFAYMNLVELKPRNDIKQVRDVAAEIFVYVYLLTFVVEEMRQISEQNRSGIRHKLQAYFSGSCNKQDAFIILTFIICTFVRFLISEEDFMISRCLFAILFCMFCLRTMQFYFAYEFVGPKVIMIRNMIRDILFFLSIFALFIISYGTLSHSLRFPNSSMGIYLLKDIIQMPYFQTYGELMLDKLFDESTCNTTHCHFQQTTVMVGFAVYLLLTNILLINLLIAMFGYTFNQIQEQSAKYWLFVRLQLVEEFYTKPILSPPLNLLHLGFYFFAMLINLCSRRNTQKISEKQRKTKSNDDENLLLSILDKNEYLKITGFEQICMEESMDEMQSSVGDYTMKSNTDSEKTKYPDKRSSQIESSNQTDNQEFLSMKSFQVRCDKRMEKLEKNIEKLILKEDA